MKARVKWVEQATFMAEADSGHAIIMDGPPDGGGRNLGSRPMEMLLMGVGGCTAYDVVHILRKGRHPVSNCEIVLDAERADTVPSVFTKIHIHFVVSGHGLQESAVARAVSLTSEKYCSASIMLSQVVEMTHDFEIINLDDAQE